MFTTTMFDLWKQEEESCKIITLCKDLDTKLGGGIPTRMITEFCGSPGSGKTQMCLQLCINAQFPKEVGGAGGRALYVDTNQGFHPDRLKEISVSMEERFAKTFAHKLTTESSGSSFTSESILDNISYVYCADYVQLLATVEHMKVLVSQIPEIKLIVIDSFSFPMRFIDDVSTRTSIIYDILRDLLRLAIDHEIAIVITNELTTRINGENSQICPALGETHGHKINLRILLSRNREAGHHVALIEKSVICPKVAIPFVIKQSGIRGIS